MAGAIKIALIQLSVGMNKDENVKRACNRIKEAAAKGANLIVLPECFNSPYGTSYFSDYAENIPGPTTNSLADSAKDNGVYVVGGSIPESNKDGKLYNTCTVWDPAGQMVAKFRKMHLTGIDIPGKIRFLESEVLSPGNKYVTFNAFSIKIGLAICYDIRFAEMAQVYAHQGCQLIIYPGAFNMATGPLHWELLQRARAVDNQVYVATASPARDETASYVAWSHSKFIDPWGEVVASADTSEDIIYGDMDLAKLEEARTSIPLLKQRRFDLFEPTKPNQVKW